MIRVRRHQRQLASGKTASVRQHERRGNPRQEWADHEDGSWWDGSGEPAPSGAGEHPEGTSYFRQDDDVFAVHPDGTVYPVVAGDGDADDEAQSPQFTHETAEGTETLPVDPSVTRCAEDRGAWGGDPGTVKDAAKGIREAVAARRGGTGDKAAVKAARERMRAATAAARETWERDMAAEAARRGVPAYQPRAARARNGKRNARRNGSSRALDRMRDDMRAWRSRPAPTPRPDKPMQPELARVLGCDTPEGREKYDRGRAYREAGYTGPLNSDNRIPDPDDPANHESLSALAALGEL